MLLSSENRTYKMEGKSISLLFMHVFFTRAASKALLMYKYLMCYVVLIQYIIWWVFNTHLCKYISIKVQTYNIMFLFCVKMYYKILYCRFCKSHAYMSAVVG